MGRAPCCDKANVKKGPWSPEEDAKLKDYIDQNGTGGNWIALPQKIDEVELLKTEFQLASGLQAELNNILFSKPSGLLQHENQITDQFECFEEFNGSKDNMLLWSNDFDTKLSSSNSWDSASVLQPGGMFQEYILGYDL
ncbi:hypothetical protein HHK36_013665 [Tetracentron sinense]|uniref:Uncharacterized protein n=1 Tax=Tetracentron sinense TaxID=13715 RepID=A0A835DGY5_TETSI|nr:hypothetical protein HHK36_013665 [Tetracentron sinense]